MFTKRGRRNLRVWPEDRLLFPSPRNGGFARGPEVKLLFRRDIGADSGTV